MMKKLFSNNKQKQTFAEDTQLSPVLDPNQAPKSNYTNAFKIENPSTEYSRFSFPNRNTQYLTDLSAPQIVQTYKEETIGISNTQPSSGMASQQQDPSSGRVVSKLTQCSPQKVWQLAGNIFNKHLAQIKSTNQALLTPQQSQKLRDKITKHINDCISLIKLQLKYKQREQDRISEQLPQNNKEDIIKQSTEMKQQTPTQSDKQINQNTPTAEQENSTTNPSNESHLDLINFCVQAFEQLSKDQTNLQETITLMEKLFKTFENYPMITNLPCIQNLQLQYASILLRCGLLKKVERCFTSLESCIQSSLKTENQKQLKEKQGLQEQDQSKEKNENIVKIDLKKQDNLKQPEQFDLSRYYCMYCEYLREQGEIDHCLEESNHIQNPRKIEAFLLKIGIFIDRQQLEQALYLIEQGKQLFQRHKQPLVFLQLMNQKLKIFLLQGQYNSIHSLFAEMKEFFEQSKLRVTIEFCQSLLYESQAYLARGNITEGIIVLEEATQIAKEILKDRYNQSSLIGDIYYLKAQAWYLQSHSITDEEERSKLLKHALSLCQLCIKIRKNYLYVKSDKNQKVIDTLSLHVNLLAATNQNREYRKASAELVEYELI